jgi:alkaline phosphatase
MRADTVKIRNRPGAAKNIILFVGDGMSITTVTAARILAGQQAGQSGEEHLLSFEQFPYTALSKTYNTNQQTPDSAGTMTAMVTGVKTRAGMLSVSDQVLRGQCEGLVEHSLPSLLELAELNGKATGIVSTARLTHATPAATYAKASERGWEDDSGLSAQAKAQGCKDIASQLINFSVGDGIEVALGGGKRHFLPAPEGKRQDGVNLIEVWQNRYADGVFVNDRTNLLEAPNDKRLLGLFDASHMQFDPKREAQELNQPSLTEMALKALSIVEQNRKGYFLMIESGRIDHAHHAGNAYNALHEAVAFSDAIAAVVEQVDLDETIIIVTADHSHVFTMAGYPTRGNPILGYVKGNDKNGKPESANTLAVDGYPYTTLGYHNGPGARPRDQEDYDNVKPHSHDYLQQSLIPGFSETHGGDDVAIYGIGPGSHLVRGVMEQNVIFHILDRAANLSKVLQ